MSYVRRALTAHVGNGRRLNGNLGRCRRTSLCGGRSLRCNWRLTTSGLPGGCGIVRHRQPSFAFGGATRPVRSWLSCKDVVGRAATFGCAGWLTFGAATEACGAGGVGPLGVGLSAMLLASRKFTGPDKPGRRVVTGLDGFGGANRNARAGACAVSPVSTAGAGAPPVDSALSGMVSSVGGRVDRLPESARLAAHESSAPAAVRSRSRRPCWRSLPCLNNAAAALLGLRRASLHPGPIVGWLRRCV